MSRETMIAKAVRLLRDGRLTVLRVDGDHVEAECAGDTGTYRLGHDPGRPGGWWCTCPARRTCAHLAALHLVAVRGSSRSFRCRACQAYEGDHHLDPGSALFARAPR
jgi:uncharacterized Zn finger protein